MIIWYNPCQNRWEQSLVTVRISIEILSKSDNSFCNYIIIFWWRMMMCISHVVEDQAHIFKSVISVDWRQTVVFRSFWKKFSIFYACRYLKERRWICNITVILKFQLTNNLWILCHLRSSGLALNCKGI